MDIACVAVCSQGRCSGTVDLSSLLGSCRGACRALCKSSTATLCRLSTEEGEGGGGGKAWGMNLP